MFQAKAFVQTERTGAAYRVQPVYDDAVAALGAVAGYAHHAIPTVRRQPAPIRKTTFPVLQGSPKW